MKNKPKCKNCGSRKWHWIRLYNDKEVCSECAVNEKEVIIGDLGVVAIYKDPDGKDVAINGRGNVVNNPYKSTDPRGWRYAGKSTKGYERTVIFK